MKAFVTKVENPSKSLSVFTQREIVKVLHLIVLLEIIAITQSIKSVRNGYRY